MAFLRMTLEIVLWPLHSHIYMFTSANTRTHTNMHTHRCSHTHTMQAKHGDAHLQPAPGRQKQDDCHKFEAYGLCREFQAG